MSKGVFQDLLDNIIKEEMFVDELLLYKKQFADFATEIITGTIDPQDPELEAFLKLCNDVYTYSVSGEVLIPDSIYDQCMKVYTSRNKMLVYADPIGKTKWDFKEHEIPGMVGSLDKIYTYKELKDYLSRYNGISHFTLAPKFDGISCSIYIENGSIISALTRYNGVQGQDITKLAQRAKNASQLFNSDVEDGYYKCELAVSTESFNDLVQHKKYANRRSATSGIINTPSNIAYANYITIIPLLYYDPWEKRTRYVAPYRQEVQYFTPSDLLEDIEKLLEKVRSKDFPFRVDGVVIYPDQTKLPPPNELDLMDTSIAFKVNTAEGKTKIRYGYMSVGRLGKAIPMLKVEPVEVNETIVEDVSLGSYDKFLSMGLHENEEVIVYSAGDVIPQIKLPSIRTNFYNAPDLKIKKVCPYCEEKLTRTNTEYSCTNEACPRIITGRIANFLIKMGLEGFSDKSVEMIYNDLGIDSIEAFLNLTVEEVTHVAGFEIDSATNLVNELTRIKQTPVSISKFFGSLGIDKISEKKCRKIFEYVTLEDLLNKKKHEKIFWELQCADGIGAKTAEAFIDFVKENRKMIESLASQIRLEGDIKYKGNVVFTGFRPTKEIEDRLHALGIEVGSSVSSGTIAVVSASMENSSGKSKAALVKGIPIFHASEMDRLFKELQLR